MPASDDCATCVPGGCCALEAVVGIDERGQLVVPKDVRIRTGIKPGDRLALVSYRGEDGGICCLALVKADAIAGAVRSVIGPALGLDT
jgi:AbrB family looped-hinge helix DNA binding protein